MKRWNGWGDEAVNYPVPTATLKIIEGLVGPGTPSHDVSLAGLVAAQPPGYSGWPEHLGVSTDPVERLKHARGQSLPDLIATRSGRHLLAPDGVAYPQTAVEVGALVEYAARSGLPLIPCGGGTSVVGHLTRLTDQVPVLSVDLSRLNRLESLDEESGLATFGAGITGADLEAQLRAGGYTLGHYPQSFEYSTLGGWIAARSSGQQSMHYGRIERLWAGGRVETPAGRLDLPAFPASAAGPDLREIVLGSEGRLGIISQATVRISALPEYETFQVVFFPGFEQGMAACRAIARARLPLSMLRLSTGVETTTNLALSSHRRAVELVENLLRLFGQGEGKCMLVFGVTGPAAIGRVTVRAALELMRKQGGVHLGPLSMELGKQWHKNRFKAPYLRNTLWELGYAVDTVETAANWTGVPALLEQVETALRTALEPHHERVHVFTHLSHVYGQGSSIYTTYLFRTSPDPDETLHRWQLLKEAASRAIVAGGGTISHQHGVGADHAPYLEAEKGALGLAALEGIFRQFDPTGVMNPGKTVAAGGKLGLPS